MLEDGDHDDELGGRRGRGIRKMFVAWYDWFRGVFSERDLGERDADREQPERQPRPRRRMGGLRTVPETAGASTAAMRAIPAR